MSPELEIMVAIWLGVTGVCQLAATVYLGMIAGRRTR